MDEDLTATAHGASLALRAQERTVNMDEWAQPHMAVFNALIVLSCPEASLGERHQAGMLVRKAFGMLTDHEACCAVMAEDFEGDGNDCNCRYLEPAYFELKQLYHVTGDDGASLAAEPRREERVRYIHENPGRWSGNIMFSSSYPARNGRFPANHPCAAGSEVFGTVGDTQSGDGPALKAFRERGYWASCFPEGDGITMTTKNGQAAIQVMADIREIFGWKVVVG